MQNLYYRTRILPGPRASCFGHPRISSSKVQQRTYPTRLGNLPAGTSFRDGVSEERWGRHFLQRDSSKSQTNVGAPAEETKEKRNMNRRRLKVSGNFGLIPDSAWEPLSARSDTFTQINPISADVTCFHQILERI